MSAAAPVPSPQADAALAAALLAVDPVGLGGVALRAGPGPARDRWTALLRAVLPADAPLRRIPRHIDDERLLGGLDMAATVAAGRPIVQQGVLAACDGGVALIAMAERMDNAGAARLTGVLDQGVVAIEREGLSARSPARIGVVAFDEGLTPEERPPQSLLERLAFHLLLFEATAREDQDAPPSPAEVAAARARLPAMTPADDGLIEGLCAVADRLGVRSPRSILFALRAARAHAALQGRVALTTEDAAVAARLVLAPRASAAPAEPEAAESETQPQHCAEPPATDGGTGETKDAPSLDQAEMMIAAIQAALPDDLLARVSGEERKGARPARARGSGAPARAAARGRPVGSRSGSLRSGDRLNLIETLRAAAPWQKLRGGGVGAGTIRVRQEDFRIRQFVQKREATTIFVVDASGSSAMQRMAEAKGAVELLLAKAYVSRSRVALISFRGTEAELLLPATRSLTRARRRLADLPGGGGTPLASAIDAALLLAQAEQARQRSPLLVFLTDGQANVGAGGAPGRAAAVADALVAARRVADAGLATVYVDTSSRPRPEGDRFARAMGALYAPLPRAEAHTVADLVGGLRTAVEGRS